MASIAKRPDGSYRARYRDASGKEYAKHFPPRQKAAAQRWLDEQVAAMVTGQWVDPKAGRLTVAEYAARWQFAQVVRDATARNTDVALRRHILPVLGSRPIGSVRVSDVQALVKALSATLAPSSVGAVYKVARQMFAAAVDDRVIASSPCHRITLPKDDRGDVVVPTVEDVAALANAVEPRYRAAVVMLAGSGLRIGELCGLRITDVDWLRRSVKVERQRLQNGKLGPVKTSKSARTVPLGQVVRDELAGHLAAYPSGEWLFTRPDGRPLDYRTWQPLWERARRRAGLDVTAHALRHFYASALIAGGASVKVVQQRLGHASAAVTLDVYAGLWPSDDELSRTVVDRAIDVLRTGCGLGEEVSTESAGRSTVNG